MNSAQSALRFRLTVILALAGFVALGSFWMNAVIKRSASNAQSLEQRTEPDYFVYNFNYLKMLPNGKPQYRMNGEKLTHFPADDSSLIDLPSYESLDPDKPPQTLRSNTAIMKEDNTKVHMHGSVVGDRVATAKTTDMHLETEYMLVFPDEDAMQTDKPVAIRRGLSTMHGVGMSANNATGEMRLHHQTRVMMAPKQ